VAAWTRARPVRRIARVILACASLLASWALPAQSTSLVVLFPEVAQPERDVFTLLRSGVEAEARRAGLDVVATSVPEGAAPGVYADRIRARMPRAVIALGRRAFELTKAMALETRVIVGGVDLPVGASADGISLVPDPRIVLATLRAVAPRIERVIVVADPDRDRWLIEPAAAAARARGLILQLHAASGVGEAAAHYLNALRYGNPRTDAIWILEDGRFITPDTLPRVIEESWSRSFLVFSSVLGHVRKGALFAHYPDLRALGERLAGLALTDSRPIEIRFLEDVKRAANVRVGSHFGPAINNAQLAQFDLVMGRD
jgi:putative tryptophan/tyrosine transport system substrate-binding protein